MTALALQAMIAAVRSPDQWRRQFVLQCVFILKVAALPIAVSIAAWGFSGPGLQAGNFLVTFGTIDRSGGFMVVAIVREFGTFVTATVVAGIVGTTITAELGARSIRGELDALQVLGVHPIGEMVTPRILALTLMMMALDVLALICGVAGGYVASVGVLGGTTGAFFVNFFANTTFLDLVASVVKVGIFGFLIGTICCYKGLNVKGGAQGVGRAVNEAVVACLIAIFFVNLVYTQFFLAAFPDVGVFR
ncbi:ABC transporter permease [Paraconexibacter antarcticus]|uniref:ABC transporter permease n=1 Tax=Paraconexibacter antarcticus TaxID=2949664 RepID=A0ABY5E202_9ACTN|nr:ABC transporter permease [Paraconexibacter antarcticus]UTI66867.1 ABC transporter permease [Paraconexibacter antarcticus]